MLLFLFLFRSILVITSILQLGFPGYNAFMAPLVFEIFLGEFYVLTSTIPIRKEVSTSTKKDCLNFYVLASTPKNYS